MTQTLCPACGHSPIPEGAERCPACDEPFASAPRRHAWNRGQGTLPLDEITPVSGTVTSAVLMHPGPAIAVITAGAGAWLLRATGLLHATSEPAWVYGVAALGLGVVAVLRFNLGPARALAQLGMLVQLGLSVVLGSSEILAPRHLLFALHALVALSMVSGEPGIRRREVSLGLGLGIALLAVLFWIRGAPTPPAPRQELVSRELGYRLLLPIGYTLLPREPAESGLKLPRGGGASIVFGGGMDVGILTVDRNAGQQPIGRCQEHLAALGSLEPPRALTRPAPERLGDSTLMYEVRTKTGAVGRLACARLPDGRFVALALVARGGDALAADAAFDEVGAGLTLK